MPITVKELQPGDIILCYGVNPVAHLQRTAKVFSRFGTLVTGGTIQALKLALGDPLEAFAGTADCNHALIVGTHDFESKDLGTGQRVPLEPVYVGEYCTGITSKDGRHVLTICKGGLKNRRDVDVTAVSERLGGRQNLSQSFGDGIELTTKATSTTAGMLSLVLKKTTPVAIPRVCHSTGGGCIWDLADEYFAFHSGQYKVFRARSAGDLPHAAGRVAKTWAAHKRDQDPAGSHYSKWKAFKASFGSHIYGPSAKSRTSNFRKHRGRIGGPPSSAFFGGGPNTHKDWFCSYFVVACYHAASEFDAEVTTHMPLDGRHTSPMTLDGFLSKSRHWQKVAEHP
jgi:hypothetical protein